MKENNQGLQANPEYVINNLVHENATLTRENAMLKAIIQEQSEKQNDSNSSAEDE